MAGALALALEWAGARRRSVLLAGSHASGEAVWAEHEGRRVSLSDLDVFVVMEDEGACRAAAARARAGRSGLAARLLALGLAAPLETAFLTAGGLAAMEARPGTLELARHGRCVDGEPELLARVPRYSAAEVGEEEITLLLENRAFELLAARLGLEAPGRLERLRARHAQLKVALDLAGLATLERGEYPDGAAARVARARALDPWPERREDLEALWIAALAWREGPVEMPADEVALDEWRRVVRAWRAAWWERSAALLSGAPEEPYRRAAAFAARARTRRRLRHAVAFPTRGGLGPGTWSRWRFASRGTPQHRLNASASILVLAAADGDDGARLAPATTSALARLGAVEVRRDHAWRDAAARALRTWDRWMLDGQRFAESR
jgi:hypothetical protein